MKIDVSKIINHPKNKEIYSDSSIDDLKKSISEVGLLQPIVINQNNQIISGNRRYKSVVELEWKRVKVIRIYTSKDDEEYLLVQYNKQRIKKYREILNEYNILKKHFEIGQGKRTDLTSVRLNKSKSGRDQVSDHIGIKSSTLGKLLFVQKHHPEYIDLLDQGIVTINQSYLQVNREVKEKKSREERKDKPFVKSSMTWRFYQKSSENMDEVKDGEIQTIITSPPYWNKRLYKNGGGLGNEETPKEFVTNLTKHLDDCWRVLNKRGSFFLNLGDTFYKGNLQNIPHKVILQLQEKGWILRNTIIWSKTNPKPSPSKSNLTPSYEFIFHLVKSLDYDYNPTLTPLKSKTKPSLPPRHRSSKGNYSNRISPYFPNFNGKNMGDYWNEEIIRTSVANQRNGMKGEHPAPFPEEIVVLPILQSSIEGQTVLDPFCGTGTTGKVSEKLNRNLIGYDIIKY